MQELSRWQRPRQCPDNEDQHCRATTLAKLPQVTVAFWALEILATTFGETAGDAVSMPLQLGYVVDA